MAELRTGPANARTVPLADGTDVFYRLTFNDELITGRVVSSWVDDMGGVRKLNRPKTGCVHLEIDLDTERHYAASERGLRLNVPEGNESGMFCRERPAHEDREWERTLERREMALELNRERARAKPGEEV